MATSDGRGTALVGRLTGFFVPEYHFVQASAHGARQVGAFLGQDNDTLSVIGQDDGFLVERFWSPEGVVQLLAFDDRGAPLGWAQLRIPWSPSEVQVASVPSGGAWVLTCMGNSNTAPNRLVLQRYDRRVSRSGPEVEVSNDAVDQSSLVVDSAGNVLAVWNPASGGDWMARWIGPDGVPLGGPFSLPQTAGFINVAAIPIPDGHVLIRVAGSFIGAAIMYQLEAPSPVTQFGPPWIGRLAAAMSAPIWGGRGLAMWPSNCGGLDLYLSDGSYCGCMPVPGDLYGASVGADGSLFVPFFGPERTGELWVPGLTGTLWYPELLR
jgi:hypothetical protein